MYCYLPGSWKRYKRVQDSTVEYYVYDGPNVLASYDSDKNLTARFVTPGLDDNLSVTRGANTYYYAADGLGSIRNVIEADEDTANTYDYYAFGDSLGTQTQGVTNAFRFTAREYESGSVLDTYYYRNRYYLSALGIFASRDAMWADVSKGWKYAGNSPVSLTDPYGLILIIAAVNCGSTTEAQQVVKDMQDLFAQLCAYGYEKGLDKKKGTGNDAWNRIKDAINDPNHLFWLIIDCKGRPDSKGAGSEAQEKYDNLAELLGDAKFTEGLPVDKDGKILAVEGTALGLLDLWGAEAGQLGTLESYLTRAGLGELPSLAARVNGAFVDAPGAYSQADKGRHPDAFVGSNPYYMNEAIHEMQHMRDTAGYPRGSPGKQAGEAGANRAENSLAAPFLILVHQHD